MPLPGSGHNNTKSVGLAQLLLTLEHLCGASSHYIHCLLSTIYTPVEETFHPALICSWCWQGMQAGELLSPVSVRSVLLVNYCSSSDLALAAVSSKW